MPLAKVTNINNNSSWLLWHLTEDLVTLKSQTFLSDFEKEELENISHPTKKKELLAGKAAIKELVRQMGAEYRGLFKDEFGKPHLSHLNWEISISHSYPYVAVLIDKNHACGIDIESPQEKIRRISKKFLSTQELEDTKDNLMELAAYWSAKEALYKLHGRRSLIFKENLFIYKVDRKDELLGSIKLLDGHEDIRLKVAEINGYIICHTISDM